MTADITTTASTDAAAVAISTGASDATRGVTSRDARKVPVFDADKDLPRAKAMRWSPRVPRWLAWLLGNLPIPRLFRWAVVTRFDDVAEVLAHDEEFAVPFDKEIARLNDGEEPGTPFILGMDDRVKHDAQLKLVMEIFQRSDVNVIPKDSETRITAPVPSLSWEFAQGVVKKFKMREEFDAIRELITRVPVHLCEKYYGVEIRDPQKFAYATIAVSSHLFGPGPKKGRPDDPADKGAEYVREIVDGAIDCELGKQKSRQNNSDQLSSGDTILKRLLEHPDQLTRKQVRALLIGMIVGFVPTNTIAGGHILEMLLRDEQYMKEARAAAMAGDDDLLKRCLFEAMRFWPLTPGPFRICKRDYTIAADTPRAATLRKDTKVLCSTRLAVLDSRQIIDPFKFIAGRPASNHMLFGYGMHWCVGIFIAQAQITQTFKALLAHPDPTLELARVGRLKLRGRFPDQLPVVFVRVKA